MAQFDVNQQASCKFFQQPTIQIEDNEGGNDADKRISFSEMAAFEACRKQGVMRGATPKQMAEMKRRCGGCWKLVLRFLADGSKCSRRGKSQVVAGPGHSVVINESGGVYTFGNNNAGQLGLGHNRQERLPQLIRSLSGVRIIHATAGVRRTMLVSDQGHVYAFGKDTYGDPEYGDNVSQDLTSPTLMESLKGIFVVQAAIGNFFTAVLSREGRVYTFSWGTNTGRLGHQTDFADRTPQPLNGSLKDIPVVQIAAGYCYLLARTCEATGMAVYSLGCGLGGKLGHGSRSDERYPRMIEHFQTSLKFQAASIAAGAWHAAAVSVDGRVCTWGWGRYGCLGHGNEDCESIPKTVHSLLGKKAVHVSTGDYTTFVVTDEGEVYSFGCSESASLGHLGTTTTSSDGQTPRHTNILQPRLVKSLKEKNEQVVQISLTNSVTWNAHTLVITKSDKLYAFGSGDKGQLGVEMGEGTSTEKWNPELVSINLR